MAKICYRSSSSSSSSPSPMWLAACAFIFLASAHQCLAVLLDTVYGFYAFVRCEIMMTKTTTSPMGNGQYFTSFWQPRWLFHLSIWTPEADIHIYFVYNFIVRFEPARSIDFHSNECLHFFLTHSQWTLSSLRNAIPQQLHVSFFGANGAYCYKATLDSMYLVANTRSGLACRGYFLKMELSDSR